MIMVHSITPEELEQQVRDCLSHLYDYSYLRDHPLVQTLVTDQSGANQVQSFRQIISETIDRLRPDTGATFHSKQARIYNILMLRYIDQQQPQDVMHQLALSERQFYRDHPKAIQTLSQLLHERLTGVAPPEVASPAADISVESEVQRVHNQAEQSGIDLHALLKGAIIATQSLANQHQVEVTLALSDELPVIGLHSGVLRQTVLLIMSQLIVRIAAGGSLSIDAELIGRMCEIAFQLESIEDDAATLYAALSGYKSLQTLINTIEGALDCEQLNAEMINVRLEIPLNQQTVLLVDDNPDMITLFQRYLAGRAYHVLIAPDAEQAIRLARQSRPDVIILDVMLPGTDGWEVLQNLKSHPATRAIPVLICSVLDALDLAQSLGADAYLKKPPSQSEFLDALARWQV